MPQDQFNWGIDGRPTQQPAQFTRTGLEFLPKGTEGFATYDPGIPNSPDGQFNLPTPTNRGKYNNSPQYQLDPNQLTPLQHYPTPTYDTGVHAYTGRLQRSIGDYYGQLIPTAQNIRNRGLQDLLKSSSTPMEGIYAGQGMDAATQARASTQEQALGTAAARGLGNSGALDRILRSTQLDYLKNRNTAQANAYTKETQRQAALAGEYQNTVNSDLDFYRNINAGRDAAVGRAPAVNIAALAGITRGASGLIAGLWPKDPQQLPSTSGTPSSGGIPNGVDYSVGNDWATGSGAGAYGSVFGGSGLSL